MPLTVFAFFMVSVQSKATTGCLGRTVGRVVKALDSQPRDRGFESRRTLSLLYLESLGKI